jgi:hypothetical protein
MKLFVVFEFSVGYSPKDYGNPRLRLQVAGARCLLGEIYAIKSDKTAEAIKDYFKKALSPTTRFWSCWLPNGPAVEPCSI